MMLFVSPFVPRLPPSPESPEYLEAIARIVAELALTECTAAVALGLFYGLTEKQIATWLSIKTCAVHERARRLYRNPGLDKQLRVAGIVGTILGPRKL